MEEESPRCTCGLEASIKTVTKVRITEKDLSQLSRIGSDLPFLPLSSFRMERIKVEGSTVVQKRVKESGASSSSGKTEVTNPEIWSTEIGQRQLQLLRLQGTTTSLAPVLLMARPPTIKDLDLDQDQAEELLEPASTVGRKVTGLATVQPPRELEVAQIIMDLDQVELVGPASIVNRKVIGQVAVQIKLEVVVRGEEEGVAEGVTEDDKFPCTL